METALQKSGRTSTSVLKLSAILASISVALYLGYSLARHKYEPGPIRAFKQDPRPFLDCLEGVRQGGARSVKVTSKLAAHGVTHIGLEANCVVFVFEGLPPDATEIIGCPLQPNADPNRIVHEMPERRTFQFIVIEDAWFYWEYDNFP
jgi:hypothetical protein